MAAAWVGFAFVGAGLYGLRADSGVRSARLTFAVSLGLHAVALLVRAA